MTKEIMDNLEYLKQVDRFEILINQMREGSLQRTERELTIEGITFLFTFGNEHGIISVNERARFITNIQVEPDFIKQASKVIEGKVTTYNLRKNNPIFRDVVTDILSEYFPKLN